MRLFALFLLGFATLFGDRVGLLRLEKDRPIDSTTVLYVQFALDHFRKEEVKSVIFDIDTPGGEVIAAVRIAEMLRAFDRENGIPITAYIDNWALSAGALLAYSCRHIAATHTASMGAAEPILMTGGKVEAASEKIKSALRSEFINAAQFYGRNSDLAEAMVDKDVILVWRDGIVKLENEDQIQFDKDRVINRKGKLLTLNAKQLEEFKVADEITDDLLSSYSEIVAYDNWKISFFAFLSHPAVMSLLVLGLILGFYLELQHPGLTLPLVIGLACLSLILLSHFALHTIMWIEAIGLVAGLALLAAEVFLFPGFGVCGVLGILLTLGSLATMTLPQFGTIQFFPEWNVSAHGVMRHLAWFCAALLIAVAAIIWGSRRMARRFSLQTTLENEPLALPAIGVEGVALTPLRPSGKVEIGGMTYEAMSDGLPIEKGKSVAVLKQESGKIYVSEK